MTDNNKYNNYNNEMKLLQKLAEESSNYSKEYEHYRDRQKKHVGEVFRGKKKTVEDYHDNHDNRNNHDDHHSVVIEDDESDDEYVARPEGSDGKDSTELPNDFINDVAHYVKYMKIIEGKSAEIKVLKSKMKEIEEKILDYLTKQNEKEVNLNGGESKLVKETKQTKEGLKEVMIKDVILKELKKQKVDGQLETVVDDILKAINEERKVKESVRLVKITKEQEERNKKKLLNKKLKEIAKNGQSA